MMRDPRRNKVPRDSRISFLANFLTLLPKIVGARPSNVRRGLRIN